MYNNIIADYTNGAYTFDTLSSATASGLVEPAYLSGLIRAMITEVVKEKRFRNKFAQFKIKKGYSGKIINRVYVNPTTGDEFTVDGLTTLFDLAPADVKGSISKYTKPLQYSTTYNKDELLKAFTSEDELTMFLNKLINALYNGSEIDDKKEFLNLISDLATKNYAVNTTPTSVTSDAVKDLGICLKKIVLDLQEESDKYNVWKRLNPHDTSAVFWSNLEDINIILPNSIYATLDVALYATLFNVDRADLDTRIFTVADDKLPEHVMAIVFDRQLIDIEEIYADMEPTFYDSSKRRFKDIYNVDNQYGINPFANCVVVWDNSSNYPSISAEGVRNQTVNVESGVAKTVVLDVYPLGANTTLTPTSAGITATTTTCTIAYDALKGYTATITATADDSITFTGGVAGTITVDVA